VTGELYGLAASPEHLAYGYASIASGSTTAEIRLSGLDGAGATTAYSETMTLPQVLRVMRWAPDGQRLYFGKEPVGLGGYILFGGLTDIWALDTTTGQATELVPRPSPNAMICIDDLSPDASLAADHCNPKVMELIDVSTHVTRTVSLPSEVADFGVVGGARFNPDGKQLAYALARNNPDNEQGWVALADVAGGPSKLIATSPANDYFSVVGFQDANTIVLQSAGQTPGVWTVSMDGQNLKRLSDGIFLGILGSSPS
jgi:Tol biopolymer transport system component